MSLLLLFPHDRKWPESSMCFQCGQQAPEGRLEFCSRCGAPFVLGSNGTRHDPLRITVFGSGAQVHRNAKRVIRAGVWGLSLVCLATGASLVYGGWIEGGRLDLVQLWVSRLGGLLLIAQGLATLWLPLRKPRETRVAGAEGAQILWLPNRKK